MVHGQVYAGYVHESTHKGGTRAGSSNWIMVGAARSAAGGVLNLTAMGSLETITWGECGYPRVLSTGAACDSDGFREYQHPHSPLMEVGARWLRPLADALAIEVFGALVAEPALGPASYVHRASAAGDPIAPISHHEMNAAHTSAGVLTAGLLSERWKLEASVFNGEPADQDRLIPDFRALRSVSARAQYAPTTAWTLQASVGRVRSGQPHHPGAEPVLRVTTASVMHAQRQNSPVRATTLAWSRMDDGVVPRHSVLLESAFRFGDGWTLFGRSEVAHRVDARHTIIEFPDGTHDHLIDARRATVAQLSVGALVELRLGAVRAGVGGRASISSLPDPVAAVYGGHHPVSFALFASVRPSVAGPAESHDATTHAQGRHSP